MSHLHALHASIPNFPMYPSRRSCDLCVLCVLGCLLDSRRGVGRHRRPRLRDNARGRCVRPLPITVCERCCACCGHQPSTTNGRNER